MPNWVANNLRVVKGDPKEVFEFVRSDKSILDFEKIVPMPPDVCAQVKAQEEAAPWRSLADGERVRLIPIPPGSYREKWRREYWGTKSNAIEPMYSKEDPDRVILFATAWNSPVLVFYALAKRFRNHKIRITSQEETKGIDVVFTLANGRLHRNEKPRPILAAAVKRQSAVRNAKVITIWDTEDYDELYEAISNFLKEGDAHVRHLRNWPEAFPTYVVSNLPISPRQAVKAFRDRHVELAREGLRRGDDPYAVWESGYISAAELRQAAKEVGITLDRNWLHKARKKRADQYVCELKRLESLVAELASDQELRRRIADATPVEPEEALVN